jgi:hypothetical protein
MPSSNPEEGILLGYILTKFEGFCCKVELLDEPIDWLLTRCVLLDWSSDVHELGDGILLLKSKSKLLHSNK